MAWSISDVAKSSGTTSRTLRHYDDMGLLRPAYIGDNGYRYYGETELLRLQQILLYREFGVPLPEIGRILDGQVDAESALRAQRSRLRDEQRRLHTIERTIEHTLDNLKEKRLMRLEEIFEGFDAKKQAGYEQELIEKYGDEAREAINEGYRKMETWTKKDAERSMDLWHKGLADVAARMNDGASPSDAAVQEAIAGHIEFIRQFWTPNRESYIGLGGMYVEDERFASQFEDVAPGLATFFRDAMVVYAEHNLA